jgi:hypothetical protein
MDVLADQSISVTSSNDEIHLLANSKIVLQAGQSAVTLEGSDITFACPGTFSVKGSGNAFVGPGGGAAELEALPTGLAQVALPQTPLVMVYSQALDFSEAPDDWLPFTLGSTVQAYSRGEHLANLSRAAEDPYTDGIVTATGIPVDYWVGTSGAWNTVEELLDADDLIDDLADDIDDEEEEDA